MNKFNEIIDTIGLWSLVLTVPLMIYGFMGKVSDYKAAKGYPSYDERLAEANRKAKRVAAAKLKEPQTVHEKIIIPPLQLVVPEAENFNIPLEELLEGNHGRLL
jgi:hypothetical protein